MSEEAETTLTIGELLEKLYDQPGNLPIVFDSGEYPQSFGSYRGYYEQFAVGKGYGERTDLFPNPTVDDFCSMLEKCCGCYFSGYKGDSFYMNEGTKIWHSDYSICSHMAIIDVEERDNKVVIKTKEMLD